MKNKNIRVLVSGSNVEALKDKGFKSSLAGIVNKAMLEGINGIMFVNNGSLGIDFLKLGEAMFNGYKSRGLKVFTAIVPEGVYDDYSVIVNTETDSDVNSNSSDSDNDSVDNDNNNIVDDNIIDNIPGGEPIEADLNEEYDDLGAESELAELDAVKGEISAFIKDSGRFNFWIDHVEAGLKFVSACYHDDTGILDYTAVNAEGERKSYSESARNPIVNADINIDTNISDKIDIVEKSDPDPYTDSFF